MVGSLGALAKVEHIDHLLPIGGLLALGGWLWAVSDISEHLGDMTYGFYLCFLGAILALIGATKLKFWKYF